MPKVFSAFDLPEVGFSPAGDPIEPVYMLDEKTGNLVKVGERNIPEEIDSFRVECDINNIISRAIYGNNPELLNQKQGVYSDLSGVPSDLAMMYHSSDFLHEFYDLLDPSVRDKVGDFSGFLDCIDNGSFADIFGEDIQKASAEKVNDGGDPNVDA